jgi:hypothetical protein
MKSRIVIGLSLIVVVLAMANLFVSHAQQAAGEPTPLTGNGAPPLSNPLKVALLKWYKANTATVFPTGMDPFGMAFDGANIWVANNASSTVTKFRANDGALIGTFSVSVPLGLCFDGANIWVTSYPAFGGAAGARPPGKSPALGNTVTKLRASDGKVLGTFNVGNGPWWPTFDGANVWVPLTGDNTVIKLRASDGKLLGTFNVGTGPYGSAFDGNSIWVTNFTGLGNGTVTKLRASDGTVLGTFAVGEGPEGIVFDGASIWVANTEGGTLTKLRASDGAVLGTFDLLGDSPSGLAFDGRDIWAAGVTGIAEVRASDGKVVLSLSQPGNSSNGIAFDGANIWVALSNDASIAKL